MESLPLETAEKIILRWDSTASEDARDKMIFSGGVDRDEADLYLQAVDEIQRSLSSVSVSSSDKVNSAIQIAMARLEDEFRNILISHTIPFDPSTSEDDPSQTLPDLLPSSTSSPKHPLTNLEQDSTETEPITNFLLTHHPVIHKGHP